MKRLKNRIQVTVPAAVLAHYARGRCRQRYKGFTDAVPGLITTWTTEIMRDKSAAGGGISGFKSRQGSSLAVYAMTIFAVHFTSLA